MELDVIAGILLEAVNEIMTPAETTRPPER